MDFRNPSWWVGLGLVVAIAGASTALASVEVLKTLKISAPVLGILFGVLLGNTVSLPQAWGGGITFAAKRVLKAAIVFYGFRVTVQQLLGVGPAGLIADVIMLFGTLTLAWWLGGRIKGCDRDVALLTGAGSAICGASAVVAAEGATQAGGEKAAIAVGTVVVYGSLSMLLYPVLFRSGLLPIDPASFGIYTGSSIHGVAHVVAAGEAAGAEVAEVAILVKMGRVFLLGPALLYIGWLARRGAQAREGARAKVPTPWFAFGFIGVVLLHSTGLVPEPVVGGINTVVKFMITMSMIALGLRTTRSAFAKVGLRPIYLAGILWVWLVVGGAGLAWGLERVFG